MLIIEKANINLQYVILPCPWYWLTSEEAVELIYY